MNWEPIDSAPKDGRKLLAWSAEADEVRFVYWDTDDEGEDGWCDDLGTVMLDTPTHWMPLPDPPAEVRR
jgi:hypothetical protein